MTQSTQNKTHVTGLYAIKDQNKIMLAWSAENKPIAYTLNIYLNKWDVDTKHYVADAETLANAQQKLEDLGSSLENIENDIFNMEADLYLSDEYARASFDPIRHFIRFDRLSNADGKILARTPQIVQLTHFDEFEGVRFNVGFEYGGKDGKKVYRVSSLTKISDDDDALDQTISLKYTNKALDDQKKLLEEESLPPEIAEKVKAYHSAALLTARNNKAQRLKDEFGFDVVGLCEGTISQEIKAEVHAVLAPFGAYYLIATVLEVGKETSETKDN